MAQVSPNNSNYLAKLLTLIVRREGGKITVPMADLMLEDGGSGVQVHVQGEGAKRELVITHVPAGARFYKVEEVTSWLSPQALPQPPISQPSRPLTAEDLISKHWTESAATPTLEEERRARDLDKRDKGRVVTLTDEGAAEAERVRRAERALREITEFGSPEPAPRERIHFSPSRPTVRVSSKP